MNLLRKSPLLFIFLSLVCTSCSRSERAQSDKINVAFFPNITHAQALVGRANGSFQQAMQGTGDDITIEWREFNAGPSEIEALFAGEIDIGYIGPVPAINGYVKSGGDLKIIAGATKGGAVMVSKKDMLINHLSELSGKKIAVPQFGNTQHLSLLNLLRENDLKTTDKGGTVEVMQIENPDIKTLLDNGSIDVALVPEPWGARLTNEIGANIVLDQKEIWRNGDYPTAVVIVRTEFLRQFPERVKIFLKTHVELTEYINENPDDAKKIINEQINELTKKPLATEVLDEAFGRLDVVYQPSLEATYEFIDILNAEGFIKECEDRENLFDLSLLMEE